MIIGAIAPDFHSSLEWLNSAPQSLREHRGRAVAIVFFSVGSAYCQNVLAELRQLQQKYADGLSVLGVHTPKFDAERDPKLVLKAINRLTVRFPVVQDANFVTWQHYGLSVWPTVILLDAEGKVVEAIVGDSPRERLDPLIEQVLERAGEADLRVYDAVAYASKQESGMPLAFPSGLAANDRHLYVSDTGHNRILECTHDGRILRQFGAGSAGFIDGGLADACFNLPRGLALWKDALYVADTGNHALRKISLMDGDVETLAGNGKAGLRPEDVVVDPRHTALNAPWSVASAFDKLYVAMAGWHQVWEYDLGRGSFRPLVGNGEMGMNDGDAMASVFAQPAGMALAQQTLFIADAASSSIRGVQLASGKVQTLVGVGLYEFGNLNGALRVARLQYPMAIALDPRTPQLWIADTYNSALKLLNPVTREVKSYDFNYRLHQPAALTVNRSSLWLANTDAHEVLRMDFDGGTPRRLSIGE
ncbi:MAG: redoxin family protein [Xanthomonadales bacterium]|jgi:thiol-disulfide isomerase/thioredoxin|nr:redoxin family protein [Xanthomonadales bacterium]